MNVTCSAEPCPVILDSACVFYSGANLLYTGIVTNDNLETALQKIDATFQSAAIGYIFNNGVIQSAPAAPVQLGGGLVQNTTIADGGFTLTFTGDLIAGKHKTIGGTASQFVKGDGSLDSTSYQPSGNYITSLSGDGTASGPGAATLTLASVNPTFGTYGSATQVPIITTDNKGRVTNITSTLIYIPSDSLSFVGDVTGFGNTGSPVTLTLNNVNLNSYPTNTALKFSVNAKGLVTSAAPLTNLDLISILGYTPVPDSRTITINGVTQDLSVNRSWFIPGVLPSQAGNAGKYLTTDGTSPSWIALPPTGVSNVTASTPLASSGGATPNISIQQASSTQDGYLSSTDWNTFDGKQDALSGTGIVTSTAGVISYISGTSTQFVKADGSLDSNTYLTTASAASTYEPIITPGTISQYWRGDKTWQTLNLQVPYDNSTSPNIVTNNTIGAVSVRRGSASDSDNVIEVQNGAGVVKVSITGDGVVNTQAVNIKGNPVVDEYMTIAYAVAL